MSLLEPETLSRPLDARMFARLYIAQQHHGDTVLNSTFGPIVAHDRAEHLIFAAANRAALAGWDEPDFVFQSYCSWSRLIGFSASYQDAISESDVVETAPFAPGCASPRWCILDVRVLDPTHIIPATILYPYPGQPRRRRAELERTDMLPVWFWQSKGSLGIPITAPTSDYLPDIPTRIHATSLKVGFWWHNYGPLEKQIQLRIKGPQADASQFHVSQRRLASTVSRAVQNAMTKYEKGDIITGRTCWEELQWRIGTSPGCITVRDVFLLGLVYVSPGRVMPLLSI